MALISLDLAQPGTSTALAGSIARHYATENYPEGELLDIVSDALRLIRSTARRYTDPTCVELSFDELEAEGRRKLIERLERGAVLAKIAKRSELFAHLKTCISNHIKGIVARNRFTVKRTGRKVPTKASGLDYDRGHKPEVSLDDPDASAALARAASTLDDLPGLEQDMREILSPVEFLVYQQLVQPNVQALNLAYIDAHRGRPARHLVVTVTHEHMARGLGLSGDTFHSIHSLVQAKVKTYMSSHGHQIEGSYHQAVSALERHFDIQIPRSTEPAVVKRLVTITARVNHQKVTPEVADLVRLVGGRPPAVDGQGNVACFGVLWQQNNRVCLQCGMYDACHVESANAGLGEVAISPKVLTGRSGVRIPVVGDAPAPANGTATPVEVDDPRPSEVPLDQAEETLVNYVNQRFKKATFDNQTYFRHAAKRPSGKMRYIFWMGRRENQLRLRFCKPSPGLIEQLDKVQGYYYLPADLAWDRMVRLIDQHANETFTAD